MQAKTENAVVYRIADGAGLHSGARSLPIAPSEYIWNKGRMPDMETLLVIGLGSMGKRRDLPLARPAAGLPVREWAFPPRAVKRLRLWAYGH